MTTLIDAQTTILQERKRPNKKDKWIKQAFRDQPFKRLEIPDFITAQTEEIIAPRSRSGIISFAQQSAMLLSSGWTKDIQ